MLMRLISVIILNRDIFSSPSRRHARSSHGSRRVTRGRGFMSRVMRRRVRGQARVIGVTGHGRRRGGGRSLLTFLSRVTKRLKRSQLSTLAAFQKIRGSITNNLNNQNIHFL